MGLKIDQSRHRRPTKKIGRRLGFSTRLKTVNVNGNSHVTRLIAGAMTPHVRPELTSSVPGFVMMKYVIYLLLSNKKRKIMDETLRFIIGASLFVAVVIFEWLKNRSSETMFSADTEK